jgi:hypothetical protein
VPTILFPICVHVQPKKAAWEGNKPAAAQVYQLKHVLRRREVVSLFAVSRRLLWQT